MPFTPLEVKSDNRSNPNAEEKQTNDTIQHARFIIDQYNSLNDIDIKTAEATARMVNAGRILSGLLVYLTSPKSRIKDAVMSTDPRKTEKIGLKVTGRPSTSGKLPKPFVSVDELQGLSPTLNHKRVTSDPDDTVDKVKITEIPTIGDDTAPENTAAVGTNLLEEPTATIRSLKGGKAFKKKNQGGKQIRNERTRTEATSAVSAYPTQRPPRKRHTRESTTPRESSEVNRTGPEECGLEQMPATRSPLPEKSDVRENTPEQLLVSEPSPQRDRAFPECGPEEHEESKAPIAENLDSGPIETDADSFPGSIGHGEDLITTADELIASSTIPKKPIQDHGNGVQGLSWAYAFNTKMDDILCDAGIWLWRKPKTYCGTQPWLRTEKFGHSVLAPVVITHDRTGDDEPIVEYDGDAVHIVPQGHHWEDSRSHEAHPDFLVPWKLAEYQASEAAGYRVWRHDRDL